MFQSELVKLQSVWTWLPQQGLQDGLPFLLIMIAMIVLARRLSARGQITDRPQPVGRTAAASGDHRRRRAFVVGDRRAAAGQHRLYRSAIISSLVTACICLSVVVITGYVGQISLAQNAFAGFSAFMLVAHRPTDWASGSRSA